MSNLIKSRYIYVKAEEKKVIDSDSRLEDIKSYYEAMINQNASPIEEEGDETSNEAGFVEGLNVKVVETIEPVEEKVPDPEQIINEAKLQAEQIINEAKAAAKEESNKILEDALKRGYEEGYKKAMAEGETLKQKLTDKCEELENEYNQMIQELEPKMADLIGAFVQKITGIMVEDKKDIILYLIHHALLQSDNSKEFHLKVSSEDFDLVNTSKEILNDLISKESILDISIDKSLEKNQCLIETDTGIIDCSLDVELEGLKQDLRLLSLRKD